MNECVNFKQKSWIGRAHVLFALLIQRVYLYGVCVCVCVVHTNILYVCTLPFMATAVTNYCVSYL